MRVVNPVYPPPGLDLQIPEGLTHETFCKQIGGDCGEYADKFENIDEVFKLTSVIYTHTHIHPIKFIERDERERSPTSTKEIYSK